MFKLWQVQGMKEANGRLGNRFHFGIALLDVNKEFEDNNDVEVTLFSKLWKAIPECKND